MNGLPYYKAYPRDFIEGTVGMPFELKAAYRLVIDAIYMQGGNLPDDPRYIAGLLGCSVKKWNSLRSALIDAGKITVRGSFLANDRADKELEILGRFQDKQRENRSRPNKNNTLQYPRCDHTEPEPDVEEEKRKRTPLPPKGGDDAGASSGQIGFDEFWSAWPLRKQGKAGAQKAFRKLPAKDRAEATNRAAAWAASWRQSYPTASDIHPATYLNNRRWEDEGPSPSNVVPLPGRPAQPARDVDLGNGWVWTPGSPVEYNLRTGEVQDAKHIRDRRMAEAEIAMRGCL